MLYIQIHKTYTHMCVCIYKFIFALEKFKIQHRTRFFNINNSRLNGTVVITQVRISNLMLVLPTLLSHLFIRSL